MTVTRVLIVDDVAQVCRDLMTALPLAGNIEIIGDARDGLEAVRLAESLKPDAILMDLEMPGMDGYEAIRQIKILHPSCKVIALTIHDYDSAREKAQRSGVDAFLVKGATMEYIVQTIINNRNDK